MISATDDQPRILVMDANERNADLLSDFLAEEGDESVVVTDYETAEEVIADASEFGVALIDVDRFDSPVWPYCDHLHTNDVPFVVLSALQPPTLRQESRDHGAPAFVGKPISKPELRRLLDTALSE
jgi:CheY-like chemotaxis protein